MGRCRWSPVGLLCRQTHGFSLRFFGLLQLIDVLCVTKLIMIVLREGYVQKFYFACNDGLKYILLEQTLSYNTLNTNKWLLKTWRNFMRPNCALTIYVWMCHYASDKKCIALFIYRRQVLIAMVLLKRVAFVSLCLCTGGRVSNFQVAVRISPPIICKQSCLERVANLLWAKVNLASYPQK